MAIKIERSQLFFISFWLGVVITPFGLILVFSDSGQSKMAHYWYSVLVFGLIFNISSINYYRKVGWSKLLWDSVFYIVGFTGLQ